MLFLTYLQGPLVNEWVKAMSAWLRLQITNNHVRLEDEWLWESTMQAFNRQFADVLEQEKASPPAKGIQNGRRRFGHIHLQI